MTKMGFAAVLSFLLLTGLPCLLRAQASDDDSYDPFADFSEYDDSESEEADLHFFKHGRFIVLGLAVGQRFWTQNLGKLYSSGGTFGFFLGYFFDLRFALQLGVLTGDYGFDFSTADTVTKGNVALTLIPINLKYYLNTQNVTKGLADLNPYVFGGFSQAFRTYTVTNLDGFGRDAATGIDLGAGLEIPVLKRKAFLGLQMGYHYISFKDRNNTITLPDGTSTGHKPNGDTWDLLALLGFNF